MTNIGVAPLDPASEIGKVRLTVGDISYVPLVPPVAGYADFRLFSDEEITQFLANASDSILAASGWAYLSLAGQAALESKSVADLDLKLDLTKRASDLRAQALQYFDLAATVDGTSEHFEVVSTGRPQTRLERWEEAAEALLDGSYEPPYNVWY